MDTLKSDHFGIETIKKLFLANAWSILKSDHFGIETKRNINACFVMEKLKSDHFGIETQMLTDNLGKARDN